MTLVEVQVKRSVILMDRIGPDNFSTLPQGALTSVLESRVLCFLAAILNFFNTRAQSASARSGTEILEVWDSQILGGSDRSPEIIK